MNVIVVDWEQGAVAPDYFKATDNVKIVGPKVADFIKNANINAANVHCIGHSLGAHVNKILKYFSYFLKRQLNKKFYTLGMRLCS